MASSQAIAPPIERVTGQSAATAASPGARGWMVSPWFDALFFANLLWPLAFLPWYVSSDGTAYIEFWQVHFLASPHRWLTLVLVSADPDRRAGRTWVFIFIALAIAAVLMGVQFATGSLAALGLAYHTWNGWHFASQHSGILRIYSLKSGGGHRGLETYALRPFILYAAVRLIPGFDQLLRYFYLDVHAVDLTMLLIPLAMLAVELSRGVAIRLPKLMYLASVCFLYSSLILAAHYDHKTLIIALVAAATVFHATEYFAIVSHYAWRRRQQGTACAFQTMARHWTLVLAWFLVSCGVIFSTADRLFVTTWYAVNLWASFLHFAYDGLIWRLRAPATAKVLEAGGGDQVSGA